MRDLLVWFAAAGEMPDWRQLDSLSRVAARLCDEPLPGPGLLRFGRGIECTWTVDETGWDGVSPYRFGLMLDHDVARLVSAHSFTQAVLRTTQRGELRRGPVRTGTRRAA